MESIINSYGNYGFCNPIFISIIAWLSIVNLCRLMKGRDDFFEYKFAFGLVYRPLRRFCRISLFLSAILLGFVAYQASTKFLWGVGNYVLGLALIWILWVIEDVLYALLGIIVNIIISFKNWIW